MSEEDEAAQALELKKKQDEIENLKVPFAPLPSSNYFVSVEVFPLVDCGHVSFFFMNEGYVIVFWLVL